MARGLDSCETSRRREGLRRPSCVARKRERGDEEGGKEVYFKGSSELSGSSIKVNPGKAHWTMSTVRTSVPALVGKVPSRTLSTTAGRTVTAVLAGSGWESSWPYLGVSGTQSRTVGDPSRKKEFPCRYMVHGDKYSCPTSSCPGHGRDPAVTQWVREVRNLGGPGTSTPRLLVAAGFIAHWSAVP